MPGPPKTPVSCTVCTACTACVKLPLRQHTNLKTGGSRPIFFVRGGVCTRGPDAQKPWQPIRKHATGNKTGSAVCKRAMAAAGFDGWGEGTG